MKKLLYSLSIIALAVLYHPYLFAQGTSLLITGRVLESREGNPIEYATILVRSGTEGELIGGTTTDPEGRFNVQSPHAAIYLEVSFIGFVTRMITEPEIRNNQLDLGDILLEEESTTLDEVVVEGERSQTEFRLDKRVFNVGQDLSSAGASALEVLNHVPSVNVTIEGQITLRGSGGVRILINGKPSVIAGEKGNALGSITADMIERIEVITNPSAKYDAEGTAGIINIVLRQENKEGINGAVTLNTGVPNNHSLGFSLNRRTEKFNLFSQVGVGHRTFPARKQTVNENLENGLYVKSDADHKKNETFYNLILGTDYHLNKRNIISISGYLGYEKETESGVTDFISLGNDGVSRAEWKRTETTEASNPKWQFDTQYQRTFSEDKGHKLLIAALGNFFGKEQRSHFGHESAIPTVHEDQQTETEFREAIYTFKADYSWPFREGWTFESGIQHQLIDISNDYAVRNLAGETWHEDPGLTNVFEMDQQVAAGYSIVAYEGKSLGVKMGLRVEATNLNTLLTNTDDASNRRYLNFFPSTHASYKINKSISFQTGYSRRIYRPGLWELNPFFNIQNNYNIETGNPYLLPEFTDAIEATGIFHLRALSANVGLYHRQTADAIENIVSVEGTVSLTKPVNAGTERTTGIELNAKFTPLDRLSVAADLHFNHLERSGQVDNYSFDFGATRWNSQVITKISLPANVDFEVTGRYRSGYQAIQGRVSENVSADMGVRKKIVKGKVIVNLSIRDIFSSNIRESRVRQSSFYLFERYQMGRFVTFGLSYGFGKGEAMEFSGQKMF